MLDLIHQILVELELICIFLQLFPYVTSLVPDILINIRILQVLRRESSAAIWQGCDELLSRQVLIIFARSHVEVNLFLAQGEYAG